MRFLILQRDSVLAINTISRGVLQEGRGYYGECVELKTEVSYVEGRWRVLLYALVHFIVYFIRIKL